MQRIPPPRVEFDIPLVDFWSLSSDGIHPRRLRYGPMTRGVNPAARQQRQTTDIHFNSEVVPTEYMNYNVLKVKIES